MSKEKEFIKVSVLIFEELGFSQVESMSWCVFLQGKVEKTKIPFRKSIRFEVIKKIEDADVVITNDLSVLAQSFSFHVPVVFVQYQNDYVESISAGNACRFLSNHVDFVADGSDDVAISDENFLESQCTEIISKIQETGFGWEMWDEHISFEVKLTLS